MNLRSIIFITTLLSFTSLSVESNAYQEMEVTNGGSIQGKATMFGKMPYPRVYHLILFPNIDMCAEIDTDDEMNRVLDDFKISADGGLKDVVIALEHVEAGKPFNKKPILSFKGLPVFDEDEFIFGLEEKILNTTKSFSLNSKKQEHNLIEALKIACRKYSKEKTGKKPFTNINIVKI